MALCLGLIASGCSRKVYVPVEGGSSAQLTQRGSLVTADTVIVTERCTVMMLPQGNREVTHRELHHFSTVRDTLVVNRCDTIRVLVPVAEPSASRTRRSLWVLAGILSTLAAIVVIYRIFRPNR